MIEYILKKLVDSGMSVAEDILSKRIKSKNQELLKKKRSAAKSHRLRLEDIERIVLDDKEKIQFQIQINKNEGFKALLKHVSLVKEWSSTIGFSDLRCTKSLDDIYIDLDVFLTPVSKHFDINERNQKISLSDAVFGSDGHVVILGAPGAGKTTSMKKLCSSVLEKHENNNENRLIPLLIRLREINSSYDEGGALLKHLSSIISFEYEIQNASNDDIADLLYPAFLYLLDEMPVIIVLDGLDEVAGASHKEIILEEFRRLCYGLNKTKVVLTCRSGEFNYHVDKSEVYEIAPLAENQIKQFTYKWIGDAQKALKFLEDVKSSPFSDAIMRPLSIAHLCAIYERIGKIPDKPKTVYRKVVGLLLEEWDEQRSIRRHSRYASFETDRKAEFLSNLAFYLTTSIKSSTFNSEQFIEAYNEIRRNFGLPDDQARLVISEVESHTGLFVQSGYEQYEFAHKSIQEYLSADYIVKLPVLLKDREIYELIPNELAIATAISSNSSIYFSELVMNRLNRMSLPHEFYDVFVNRVILERPEFYEHKELVVALYVLLSLWVPEQKITGKNIRVRNEISELLGHYDEYIRSLSGSLIQSVLDENYSHSGELPIRVGETILHRYKRTRRHDYYNLPLWILVCEQSCV